MAFGFGILRLGPAAFWSMTPLELAAAYRGLAGDARNIGQPDLASLMQLFPDEDRTI
jgi:uncharacterized phage protein (TIGR02216 family)